jgi:hypothetical protein
LRRESEEHMMQGRRVKFVVSGFAGHSNWSVEMTLKD